MTSVPSVIRDLVERFERNRDSYVSAAYNEAQLRREFLDPFFKALGWDVDNEAGLADKYKDVVHEDSIRVTESEALKAPDYCFRIGGTRKFFVEAKKPSVYIQGDSKPAFQIRRYAWSAKLPLSILTNFEEFAVYDCRVRPAKDDKSSAARIIFVPYTDYLAKWDEIAAVFSKDAVLKGSFDRYAESVKGKKGTAEVDADLLREIESWREELAHNIALRNPDLTVDELNTAVSRTIDRILFLRVCEDRGTEQDEQLKSFLKGTDVYRRLFELFHRADERYNSGLFHFSRETGREEAPDELTPKLKIDDTPLKGIIRSLYYPDCPYVWSQIPADILGQVYEQFLGKVIRLTKGHQAKVEDKPEVKKAGGVYYTPTYIVDYIVQHTVGKLLEGKIPKEAAKLRILDPACGSGSFLIGAYQHLLDWYLEAYVKEAEAAPRGRKGQVPIYQGAHGGWRLTLAERKRILLDHIYGVDIDAQAVEVTKLSLLLKVLEGETHDTLESELKLRIRALPDLAANIKCGNSLIGTDFYEFVEARGFSKNKVEARGFSKNKVEARGFSKNKVEARGFSPLSEEDSRRINPFDWQDEFKEVFSERSRTFWLVTFVTHNARVSDRMVEFGVQKGEPLIFTDEERERVADILSALWKEHGIPVVAGNVLSDHVHLVMAAENETELDEHVRKLKGASAYRFSREVRPSEGGHVWQQKFNRKPLTTERALHDAQEYVWNNHLKHDSAPPDKGLKPPCLTTNSGKGLQPLVNAEEADKGLKPLASPLLPLVSPSPPYLERLRAACTSVEDAAMIRGGFDAVIGNPPYGASFSESEKGYLAREYPVLMGQPESYEYFLYRGLSLGNKEAYLSYIVPTNFIESERAEGLRNVLLNSGHISALSSFRYNVWKVNAAETLVIVFRKGSRPGKTRVVHPRNPEEFVADANYTEVGQTEWAETKGKRFLIRANAALLRRIENDHPRLQDICDSSQGIIVYKTREQGERNPYIAERKSGSQWKKLLDTHSRVQRYDLQWGHKYLKYGDWLWCRRDSKYFECPKILFVRLRNKSLQRKLVATYDEDKYYNRDNFNNIILKDDRYSLKYVLGLFNSTLLNYWYKAYFDNVNINPAQVRLIPIRTIDFSDKKDKARHDKMVSLVEKMLELNKDFQEARTDTEQTRLKRQIAATDKQIDQLVYELYGLTEEEIRIVEGTEGKDLRPET